MRKKIWIICLFPEIIKSSLSYGVSSKAFFDSSTVLQLEFLNPSDFMPKGHKDLDSSPYGGGPGMLMRADRMEKVLEDGLPKRPLNDHYHFIWTSPEGEIWDNQLAQKKAQTLRVATEKEWVFICGRYEGIDQRFIDQYIDEIFSIGDYVLSGGELAVSIILDSVARFLPGVLGEEKSALEDSFEDGLLEHPQYTRPKEWRGLSVPEVLASGHHEKIQQWQKEQREIRTQKLRPDLWERYKRS